MKLERQAKIIELIDKLDIETQEELAEKLMEAGFYVTQATISRDIRELKLTKIAIEDGRQKYAILSNQEKNLNEKFIRVFKNGFLSMDKAGNLIVIKTMTGMASAVAAAIDALDFDEIIGTLAGDDTMFCAIRSEEEALDLMNKINRIVHTSL